MDAVPASTVRDPATGPIRVSAVDTVEHFQGGERAVVLVSATESDRDYLRAAGEYLLEPRRLNGGHDSGSLVIRPSVCYAWSQASPPVWTVGSGLRRRYNLAARCPRCRDSSDQLPTVLGPRS
jgi:hypothetical protein